MSDNLKLNADVQDSARDVLAIVAKSLMSAIKGGAEEARMALEAELARQKVAHAFLVERIKQEAVGGLLVELQQQHDDLAAQLRKLADRPRAHPLRLACEHRIRIVEKQQAEVLKALGIDPEPAPPAIDYQPADDGDGVLVRQHRRRKPVASGVAVA